MIAKEILRVVNMSVKKCGSQEVYEKIRMVGHFLGSDLAFDRR